MYILLPIYLQKKKYVNKTRFIPYYKLHWPSLHYVHFHTVMCCECCDVWRRIVYIFIYIYILWCTQVGSVNKLRVRVKGGGDRRVSIHNVSLRHRELVSSLYSPSQNVSCFNLVQTPPWWIACSINLDCFFKLFPSSPSPCVNKLSNPLISAGTRYHLTSLPLPLLHHHYPFFLLTTLHFELSAPSFYAVPAMKLINLVVAANIQNRRSVADVGYGYALCKLFYDIIMIWCF